MNTHPSRSGGYSLLEVLVAILVLSIGVLGVAAMLTSTLRETRGAANHSKAVALAWDMVERIRANRAAGMAYESDEDATGGSRGCRATHANDTPQSCSSEDLAAHDIHEWKTALADREHGLPEGSGSIEINASTAPPTYTVTVSWTEGRGDDDERLVQVVTQL